MAVSNLSVELKIKITSTKNSPFKKKKTQLKITGKLKITSITVQDIY